MTSNKNKNLNIAGRKEPPGFRYLATPEGAYDKVEPDPNGNRAQRRAYRKLKKGDAG